ncbi:MAG: YdcF family protein [Clostridia bacterium]|nr:YdcF family protein [Clostridia bacterium]
MKLQKIITVFGALVFLAFSPLVSFMFTFMSGLGMCVGIVIFLFGIFMPGVLGFLKKHKLLRILICVVLTLALLWALLCSVFMLIYGTRSSRDSDTVIVLGCQIKGDGPSKMLRQRLDKAYDYLQENPDSVAIMSGGQGADEIMPEAEAMYNYLVEKGVDPKRLYIEPDSHNTQQNMLYSAEIIKKEGLDTNVVVITQSFHQYRAFVYAGKAGLNSYALNCRTSPGAFPTCWLRELFGIAKMYLVLMGI